MKYQFINCDGDLICIGVPGLRVFFKIAEPDEYDDGFETVEELQKMYQTTLITQEMLDAGAKWLESQKSTRNQTMKRDILNVVSDLATDLMYYDRKEDDTLPVGSIEKAIEDGIITVDEIVAAFRAGIKD
jgi:hypothetical protein